jgi:D-glycero-D-manno-heptose 1,7-bisphosphate phosphatase
MKRDVLAADGRIDRIYYCPHGWDEGCDCRKPKPGMLLQAQKDFSLDLTRVCFVGDDERDAEAAEAAGCPFIGVTGSRSLLDIVRELLGLRESAADDERPQTVWVKAGRRFQGGDYSAVIEARSQRPQVDENRK